MMEEIAKSFVEEKHMDRVNLWKNVFLLVLFFLVFWWSNWWVYQKRNRRLCGKLEKKYVHTLDRWYAK